MMDDEADLLELAELVNDDSGLQELARLVSDALADPMLLDIEERRP